MTKYSILDKEDNLLEVFDDTDSAKTITERSEEIGGARAEIAPDDAEVVEFSGPAPGPEPESDPTNLRLFTPEEEAEMKARGEDPQQNTNDMAAADELVLDGEEEEVVEKEEVVEEDPSTLEAPAQPEPFI